MDNFDEIAKKRSMPGVLILNSDNAAVYVSDEARRHLKEIAKSCDSKVPIPHEVVELCKAMKRSPPPVEEGGSHDNCLCFSQDGKRYLLRVSALRRAGEEKSTNLSHIMVVIEPLTEGRSIDINDVMDRFDLTNREAQITAEIVKGSTNRQIAQALYISEDTVKDHIKHIMKKLDVHTRTSVLHKALE